MTLHNEINLRHATNHLGTDVTSALKKVDLDRVSPTHMRAPQLKGLAEPHSVTLDFGPLDTTQPLALVMNGWIRFGGGMANVTASLEPELPFPFPTLEAETSEGWKPVDVMVGAPAGKTKTILADLSNKLPAGTKRLRLTTAFEIHWDRIALMVKAGEAGTSMATLSPSKTDLHWRGYGVLEDLPWTHPTTPSYTNVSGAPVWRITPSGWCTRYGEVGELVAQRDEALVLVNGGDELTLEFSAATIPPKPAGMQRDFFLYVDGWDKDADVHVTRGWEVLPFPYHGMNDQTYGFEPEVEMPAWAQKYNTRWVGPFTLKREPGREPRTVTQR